VQACVDGARTVMAMKLSITKLAALTVAFSSAGVVISQPVSAVAYPQKRVSATTAPYVASIYFNEAPGYLDQSLICTGSLIDDRHVLTAAHCVRGIEASQLLVGLGGSSQSSGMMLYGVMDFEAHLRYTDPVTNDEIGLPNDIALIRLASPATGVQPVLLPKGSDTSIRKSRKGMAIYGWGSDQNGELNDLLGYSKQKDYSAKAKRWFKRFNSRTQLAAGLPLRGEKLFSSACTGDSGGPLVGYDAKGRHVVLGVVSYGLASCRASAPSVFTRVTAYKSWISQARTAMATRQDTKSLQYGLLDSLYDAQGTNLAAELKEAYIATTVNHISVEAVALYESPYNDYDATALFYGDDPDNPIAYMDWRGLQRVSDGVVLCPALEGTQTSATISTACALSFIPAALDVRITLEAYPVGATVPTGYDELYFEYVYIPVR
jgi:secreted trypsin-like serine protease